MALWQNIVAKSVIISIIPRLAIRIMGLNQAQPLRICQIVGFVLNAAWERICLKRFNMRRLTDEITQFFLNQGFAIISTIDKDGSLHNSCKGIVKINRSGSVFLLDLYKGRTYENLKQNPHISITAVDEHRFIGYCLKGRAEIIAGNKLKSQIIKAWEAKITGRISSRVIKNIQGQKGHSRHPEARLPKPEYLIVMEVREVIDLTPHHIRQVN